MIFASFFIFDSTVSQKMDHFDISFVCSIFSKSWEVTNYGFLGVTHLPLSPQSYKYVMVDLIDLKICSMLKGSACCLNILLLMLLRPSFVSIAVVSR